jgi:hypothetical protein
VEFLNIKNKLIIAQCQGSRIPGMSGTIYEKKEQPEAVNLKTVNAITKSIRTKIKYIELFGFTCI